MKRLVVLLLIVGLVGVLGGTTPVSAAKESCQVLASDRARSCSIIATGSRISAIVLGTGTVAVYESGGLRYMQYCPLAAASCLGQPIRFVRPGQLVVLTVNVGYGRVKNGGPV